MNSEMIIKLFNNLPAQFQQEALHFLEFLSQKAKKRKSPKKSGSLFGHAKEHIWIAPDFDEPLEDFNEYM